MTDTKKNDFNQTNEALADLSAELLHLSEVVELKKQEWKTKEKNLQGEIENKSKTINVLTESYTNIIDNIDGIIGHINKVLEKDGSSYDNN